MMFTHQRPRRRFAAVVAVTAAVAAAVGLAGCGPAAVKRESPAVAADKRDRVVVAVATPLQDTGLADQMAAGFSRQYPEYAVRVVAMDPSAAVAAARAGTADALVVPRSAQLAEFLKAGFAGAAAAPLMTDSWVLVGPADDPAGARSASGVSAALAAIAAKAAVLSRPGQVPVRFFAPAGSSGPGGVVASAWKGSGADPTRKAWYSEVGGGLSDLVKAAAKGNGYAIVDRATYTMLKPSLQSIKPLRTTGVAPDDVYVVVQAAGAQSPKAAAAFTSWVSGPAGKGLVASLGIAADGRPLFGEAVSGK